jgi:hypothetical protein
MDRADPAPHFTRIRFDEIEALIDRQQRLLRELRARPSGPRYAALHDEFLATLESVEALLPSTAHATSGRPLRRNFRPSGRTI